MVESVLQRSHKVSHAPLIFITFPIASLSRGGGSFVLYNEMYKETPHTLPQEWGYCDLCLPYGADNKAWKEEGVWSKDSLCSIDRFSFVRRSAAGEGIKPALASGNVLTRRSISGGEIESGAHNNARQ
jgi:hypothetical protein